MFQPIAARCRRCAEFKNQQPFRREHVRQGPQELFLVNGIVQGRGAENDIKFFRLVQIFPILLKKDALGEEAPGGGEKGRITINAQDLARALKKGVAAEKALIAAHIQKAFARQRGQSQTGKFFQRVGRAGAIGEGLITRHLMFLADLAQGMTPPKARPVRMSLSMPRRVGRVRKKGRAERPEAFHRVRPRAGNQATGDASLEPQEKHAPPGCNAAIPCGAFVLSDQESGSSSAASRVRGSRSSAASRAASNLRFKAAK